MADKAINSYGVRNVRAKSIRVKQQDRDKRTLTLRFNATAESDVYNMAECEVDFVVDAQGRCRIQSFRVYKPFADNVEPEDVFRGL